MNQWHKFNEYVGQAAQALKASHGIGDQVGWSVEESLVICGLWQSMYQATLDGIKFNKAATIRALQATGAPLEDRSRGSIEAKLMNVSAANVALGGEFLKGYKPAPARAKLLDQILYTRPVKLVAGELAGMLNNLIGSSYPVEIEDQVTLRWLQFQKIITDQNANRSTIDTRS